MGSQFIRPLVSLCIPTYNRLDPLKRCLESIVGNIGYDSQLVEIVVSDNMSSDGTEEMMNSFVRDYPEVIYNRNRENIGGERNFLKVLSLAHGHFVKLHNDYCEFSEKGLLFLVNIVKDNLTSKDPIFFEISNYTNLHLEKYTSFEKFVEKEFLRLSWISAIGMWKDDFDRLTNKDAAMSLQFMQTDWWLRLAMGKARVLVCCGDIFHRIPFSQTHGDFDYIGVFLKYPIVFQPLIKNGIISNKTQKVLDFKLLENLSLWFYRLNINKDTHYSYIHDKSYSKIKSYFSKYRCWNFWFLLYIMKAMLHNLHQLLLTKMKERYTFLSPFVGITRYSIWI